MSVLTLEELATLPQETKLLEIGCGPKKLWPHSIAVDVNPASVADVIDFIGYRPQFSA